MTNIDLVLDLQYGSTGKGLIVGHLAEKNGYDTVITAWAPNAGHTYINRDGRKFIHTHLANGIVSPYIRRVLLGPGSLINPAQLLAEIEECADIIRDKDIDIMIHPHAAVVTQRHVDEEAGPMTKIGSTKKGVGAAMQQRIRRDPEDMNIAASCPELEDYIVTVEGYNQAVSASHRILIEGAQGFGLSMYHGFYPYTTSRDVSTWQILADCAIPREILYDEVGRSRLKVIGTARTYPIRVANRFDTQGTMVGYSGPVYGDQVEIDFATIGQQIELTTVTRLPRRIFTFSALQISDAVRMNGPDFVFLNFINYVRDRRELICIVQAIEHTEHAPIVKWLGAGPTTGDVYDTEFNDPILRMNKIVEIWEKSCFK